MQKKSIKNMIISSASWSIFTMFVWEFLEEGLESIIAITLSSAVAIFVTKALSTLAVITATQGVKVGIKRFVYPFIVKILKKEGNDKMKFIKNIFKLIYANKITIIEILAVGYIAYFGVMYLCLEYNIFAPYSYILLGGVELFCAVLTVYLGGEKIIDYIRRVAVSKLDKDTQLKIGLEIDKVLAVAKKTKEDAIKFDLIMKEAKAELEAKNNAEVKALAEKKLAEQSKVLTHSNTIVN